MNFDRQSLRFDRIMRSALFSKDGSKAELRVVQISLLPYNAQYSKLVGLSLMQYHTHEKRLNEGCIKDNLPAVNSQYFFLNDGMTQGGYSNTIISGDFVKGEYTETGRMLTYALLRKSKMKGIPDAILKR
jgi:hypothetical protein